MLLYELALELGVRSTALMDRAHALGINVSSTDPLTPEQVARLREAYGKARHAPQATGAAPTGVVLAYQAPPRSAALAALVGPGLVSGPRGAHRRPRPFARCCACSSSPPAAAPSGSR